ncbi:hypothetical protein ACXC9Q_12525 [Kribbella sp. CWNU-51]
MHEQLISALIGSVSGIATSYLVWWYVARRLVSKILFSDAISVRPDFSAQGIAEGLVKYRVKIHNSGRRAAIDLTIHAMIRSASRDPDAPDNVQLISLGVATVPAPRLDAKRGRTMNLKTELIPEAHRRHLSEAHREALQNGKRVPLEEILQWLGPGAIVRIWVSCYDEFSGSRRVFVSKDYSEADFTSRQFESNGVKVALGGPR